MVLPPYQRVTIRQAFDRLAICGKAVSMHVKRGQMCRKLREGKRYYLYFHKADGEENVGQNIGNTLTAALKDQVAYLRAQLNAEKETNHEDRRIILTLTSRKRVLETFQDSPFTKGTDQGSSTTYVQTLLQHPQ